MPEEIGQAQPRRIRLGKALDGITCCVERSIKELGARPGAAAFGERRETFCNDRDSSLAAAPPRKRNDMIAMWPAHFERVIVAIGVDLSEFNPQFQEMPDPGQLQMAIGPVLREAMPVYV